jgi:hypothetical protein
VVDPNEKSKKAKKQKNKKTKRSNKTKSKRTRKENIFFGERKLWLWHKKGETGKVRKVRTFQRKEENGDGKEASQGR